MKIALRLIFAPLVLAFLMILSAGVLLVWISDKTYDHDAAFKASNICAEWMKSKFFHG